MTSDELLKYFSELYITNVLESKLLSITEASEVPELYQNYKIICEFDIQDPYHFSHDHRETYFETLINECISQFVNSRCIYTVRIGKNSRFSSDPDYINLVLFFSSEADRDAFKTHMLMLKVAQDN